MVGWNGVGVVLAFWVLRVVCGLGLGCCVVYYWFCLLLLGVSWGLFWWDIGGILLGVWGGFFVVLVALLVCVRNDFFAVLFLVFCLFVGLVVGGLGVVVVSLVLFSFGLFV